MSNVAGYERITRDISKNQTIDRSMLSYREMPIDHRKNYYFRDTADNHYPRNSSIKEKDRNVFMDVDNSRIYRFQSETQLPRDDIPFKGSRNVSTLV